MPSVFPKEATSERPVALQVRGLTRRFGARTVVDALDVTVHEGDLYGFLGPNGAGKTTTMRCILGLLRTHGGEIRIFGEQGVVRQRVGVGAMVEVPSFHDWLSARTNLRVAQSYIGGGAVAEIDEVLDKVGLLARGADRVGAYSQGMRQRLGIARALLGNPRLLLLDEPTVGLDPRGMREVRDLLRMLHQRGVTVFLSSHLLGEVEAICDRVGILDGGRLVAEGPVARLLAEMSEHRDCEVAVDRPEALATLLEGMKDAALVGGEGEGGRLVVRLRGVDPADFNRRLVGAGLAVGALVPRTRRLEDLYLERTRKEVR